MSVRVGISLGGFPFSDTAAFWRWVDLCDKSDIDSLWLSDRIVGPQFNLESNSDAAVERTARYGHGWISGGGSAPAQTGKVIAAIKAKAAQVGRSIDDDHYGAGFNFRYGSWDEPLVLRSVQALRGRIGEADPK